MYNKAIIMGRICNGLELKTTSNGISVLSFRLAVDRSYQAKGEERKTDFLNIVAWRNTAEFINRYFSKGRMILVEGELQSRQYVDKNNVNQTVVEIIAINASFTGEPKPGGGYKNQNADYSGSNGNSGSQTYPHSDKTHNNSPEMSPGDTQDYVQNTDSEEYPF